MKTTYLQLSFQDLTLLSAALGQLVAEPAKVLRRRIDERIEELNDPAIQALQEQYRSGAEIHNKDGELEIEQGGLVSLGDDPGAYVMAWRWVTNAEAGVEEEVKE